MQVRRSGWNVLDRRIGRSPAAPDAERYTVDAMKDPVDTSKTLDELDPPAWGEPSYDSYLVTTCDRLRKKPIGDFSVEDLRIVIGQGIGLLWLMPLALRVLELDSLSEGDLYPGDLLTSVLHVDSTFWACEPEWRDRVLLLLDQLREVPRELG